MYPVNTFLSALVLGFGFSCGIALFVYLAFLWETRNNKKIESFKVNNPYEGDMFISGNLHVGKNITADGVVIASTGGVKE